MAAGPGGSIEKTQQSFQCLRSKNEHEWNLQRSTRPVRCSIQIQDILNWIQQLLNLEFFIDFEK